MARDRIVVGVDDTTGARSALNWAAQECRIRGHSLLIVHVPGRRESEWLTRHGDPGMPAMAAVGSLLLQEVAFATRIRFPELQIELMLGEGDPARTLTDLSEVADLLVLGTRGQGSSLVTLTGSVSALVAAHAGCPVVIVPERPALPASGPEEPTVLVGVSATRAGVAALRFAFDEAALRGISVTAVHALGEQPADSSEADRLIAARTELEADLAFYIEEFPDVTVVAEVVPGHPAQAMLRLAPTAELVVLGAHHSDDRWSSRLGPVPQTVLHHTSCPVVLIGTPHEHTHRYLASVPVGA